MLLVIKCWQLRSIQVPIVCNLPILLSMSLPVCFHTNLPTWNLAVKGIRGWVCLKIAPLANQVYHRLPREIAVLQHLCHIHIRIHSHLYIPEQALKQLPLNFSGAPAVHGVQAASFPAWDLGNSTCPMFNDVQWCSMGKPCGFVWNLSIPVPIGFPLVN